MVFWEYSFKWDLSDLVYRYVNDIVYLLLQNVLPQNLVTRNNKLFISQFTGSTFHHFHESLSEGMPHNMETGFPRGSDPRWNLSSFHNLISKVTFHQFCILFAKRANKSLLNSMNIRSQRSLRCILESAYYVAINNQLDGWIDRQSD